MKKLFSILCLCTFFSFSQPTRNWGTYYYGSGNETGNSVVTDASGNIYMAGTVLSTTFVSTPGCHQATYSGGESDAFLVKFNSAGVRQWATYYGGVMTDQGLAVSVDASGNVYLVGKTNSTSSISTVGSQQALFGGGTDDAFVVKFNSTGVRQWATYYGGSGSDQGRGVVVDASGNVFVVGLTGSTSSIATAGSHQQAFSGWWEAFLVKFNTTGVRQWGTYYGGTGYDYGYCITKDGSGNVYIGGETSSTASISTVGSQQTTNGGGIDGFIAKFNTSGVRQWGSFYGGTGSDFVYGVYADNGGNVSFTGNTNSSSGISTAGSHQSLWSGGTDAFLVHFNATGIRQWATYYGGVNNDKGNSISGDPAGRIYLCGNTNSNASISTIGSYQVSSGGLDESFFVRFDINGNRLWGSYYGGANYDYLNGICFDAFSSSVIMTGNSDSPSSIATIGSHQTVLRGFNDPYLVKTDTTSMVQWSTYYGGTGDGGSGCENIISTTVDKFGNVYIAGWTGVNCFGSASGLATPGSHQASYGGGSCDAIIAKFNSAGVKQWATYYGGPGGDSGYGVAVDSSGNIYLAGSTNSSVNISTPGSFKAVMTSTLDDAFIVKFNSAGVRQWATYFGGTGMDAALALTVAGDGSAYIGGITNSTANIASVGAHDNSFGAGVYDAFAAKFSSTGTRVWSTYYGDAGLERFLGIAIDANENVFACGHTNSSNNIATPGSHQPTLAGIGGFDEAFLVKLDSNGVRQWGTYYGGEYDEEGYEVAVDHSSGNVYLTGITNSTVGISTPGSYQTTINGTQDGFLAQFNNNGVRQWGTYFGGPSGEWGGSLSVDPSIGVYYGGSTQSTSGISTPGAHQTSLSGIQDIFICKFSSSGLRLWSTYYGGSASNEYVGGLSAASGGIIYLGGQTSSTLAIATPGSYLSVHGGNEDGFLVQFSSSASTDVAEINVTSDLKIFPNPNNGIFHLLCKEKIINVQIMDMLGRIILKTKAGDTHFTFDISETNSGIYLAHIETENRIEIIKIIKN